MSSPTWDRLADAKGPMRAAWDSDAPSDMLDRVMAILPERDGNVVDYGAGPGRLAIPVAEARPDLLVWAVDVSAKMLAPVVEASRRLDNLRVLLVDGDGRDWLAWPPRIDAGWSVLCLQHNPVAVQDRVVTGMTERLADGGRLLFQFVTDADPGPLSHATTRHRMKQAAFASGHRPLTVGAYGDPNQPTWSWMEVTR